jgi:hypothetical protein
MSDALKGATGMTAERSDTTASAPSISESTSPAALAMCGFISMHTASALGRAGIHTIGDLVTADWERIRRVRGVGEIGRAELAKLLRSLGYPEAWDAELLASLTDMIRRLAARVDALARLLEQSVQLFQRGVVVRLSEQDGELLAELGDAMRTLSRTRWAVPNDPRWLEDFLAVLEMNPGRLERLRRAILGVPSQAWRTHQPGQEGESNQDGEEVH